MPNFETMIKWMADRVGKVTYSQNQRLGPYSYDCSSAVYFALRAGGFLAANKIGNTDSLFKDLEAAGWKQVPLVNGYYAVKRGDIFIWGIRGASGGDFGHTGIFLNENDQMIHCNFGYNGISINDHDTIWAYNGKPAVTVYRYAGQTSGNGSGSDVSNTNDGGNTVETPKGEWLAESATFYPNTTINLRTAATTGAAVIAKITPGQSIKYDAYKVDSNGHVWIRQPRANGAYGYLATGTTANGKRNATPWGTFK
ncbi:SH3 domain-containing protein [Enterococcus sp. BWB1-3]|uniref:peptidoglycan amidohydrolase family protein n=1 Tax=Enterococcus sp. BWB1-3 TaxID=2787713 RepID=UPI0019228F6A|nr:peptidoglycan amidohydrolase family protein [Enterococcus sp. BWB1-3]MBL1228774.1 SH3 domain-containing protein [Enterococcus sp. BWB1-3]